MPFALSGLPHVGVASSTRVLIQSARGSILAVSKTTRSNSSARAYNQDAKSAIVVARSTTIPAGSRYATLSQRAVRGVAKVVPASIRKNGTLLNISTLPVPELLQPISSRALASKPLGALTSVCALRTHRLARLQQLVLASMVQPPARQIRGFGTGPFSQSLLTNREAAANRNPMSSTAQNAFYQALLKANMPVIVIERYQSGRFATDEKCDEAYQTALNLMGSTVAPGSCIGTSGMSQSQLQAVSQAVAASQQGGSVAMGKTAKDGTIHVTVDESLGSIVFKWVKFVLWFLLITYCSMVVFTLGIEVLNLFKRASGAKEVTEVKPEHQKTRFADVHGCDEAKDELQELVEFLRSPEKFNTLGGKMPKGVLLVGPPGTGKTLLARAVAGEAGVPFLYMSGSEFDEIYVGVGAKRVRDLFAAARSKSPAIIFIDELDAIGARRHSKDAAYIKQTLNQLLTELDGFEQNSGVIIIGATNFPGALDKALVRPGRFDRHVRVDLPDVRGRVAILRHHASKIKMDSAVNLDAIAGSTPGLSGAELENIVNQAAVHASKLKAKMVGQFDFEYAKDKVIMGAEKKHMVITAKEKEMTAYHEAGHALVIWYGKETGKSLYKVTVLPRGESLGHTAFLPDMDKYSWSAREYLAQMEASMGGKAAEELVYGAHNVTSGAGADLDSATRVAWAMVGKMGFSDRLGPVDYLGNYDKLSSETRAMVEAEVKRLCEEAYKRAMCLLQDKRKELDLLAKALVEYETLDKTEVEKVLRGEQLTGRPSIGPGPMKVHKSPSFSAFPRPGFGPSEESGSSSPPPPVAPPPAV